MVYICLLLFDVYSESDSDSFSSTGAKPGVKPGTEIKPRLTFFIGGATLLFRHS